MQTSAQRLHATDQLLVDIDNVSVRYEAERILERVSFCMHRGEFIGLIGQNGAGKTTLLRVILGLEQATQGNVNRHQARIGYVPQRGNHYNAIVPVSVLEVVKLGARGSTQQAMQALEEVGMSHAARKRFSELSGGQQQRVIIAKSLAGDTDILFLDEPTTGIDERSQDEFYSLLSTLRQKGITIVMVSHDVDAVLKLVTRVICLNQSILYDGSPDHFEADKYMPAFYKARHIQLHHDHSRDNHAGGQHA